MSGRADWDTYFMRIAEGVSTRATCDRRHVGVVIVRDKAILSTGYNGSLRGLDHCDDVGHLMVDGHCERTVHAEANAIAHAAKFGVRLDASTLYVTTFPCFTCFKLSVNAGVIRVVYASAYVDRTEGQVDFAAKQLGIEIKRIELAERPIDMMLFCPRCHIQHIDAPELSSGADQMCFDINLDAVNDYVVWNNPPHRSHKCHNCKHIWRPSDVPTNGVATIKTRGRHDS